MNLILEEAASIQASAAYVAEMGRIAPTFLAAVYQERSAVLSRAARRLYRASGDMRDI